MDHGIEYQFPPFEGKVAKFGNLSSKLVVRVPSHPDINKVYLIHSTETEVIKSDGYNWGPTNKSKIFKKKS